MIGQSLMALPTVQMRHKITVTKVIDEAVEKC